MVGCVLWVCSVVCTSMLDYRPRCQQLKSSRKCIHRFLFHLCLLNPEDHDLCHLTNSDIASLPSTLTVLCWWEEEITREMTGHSPSYAEAKKYDGANTSYP